jgi:segregation and condensation protein A
MYRVILESFEGPMDLLLFFIRRDELDIYDIPIARISEEYLQYVRLLEEIDLDRAGDFIYMAALLISIKARMMLPRSENVAKETEEIDPRQELVERLLEYIRYKEATEVLDSRHQRRLERYTRPPEVANDFMADENVQEWVNTSVFDLVNALRRVLAEAPDEPVHAIRAIEYTVEAQQEYVEEVLRNQGRFGFIALVRGHSKPFIIATLLAVLELARAGRVVILIDDVPDEFIVTATDTEPEIQEQQSLPSEAGL